MFDSPLDEDQEIAENILNRIFYEQATHDRVIALLKSYNNQDFSYLDACTELSHVFLRLLERYSKQNVDLQVRSRRRARKKKRKSNDPNQDPSNENEDRELEAEDVAEAQRTTNERKFDFTRFAARFLTQSSVDTYVAFLRLYKDLNDDQLKRAHRFFYRLAFKMDLSVFLFRLDVVSLLNKLVKGPEGLDLENSTFKEWEELVRQVFRKLIKRMQDRPALAVELLFSKINSTMFYLEHGYEREIAKKAPRAPAEVEVKPGMDKAQQIGVAVSVLINQSKSDLLAWLKEVLSSASSERKAWQDESSARNSIENSEFNVIETRETEDETQQDGSVPAEDPLQPEQQQRPQAPSIFVKSDNDEHKNAMQRDKHVRLLMSLLGFLRLVEDEVDCTWIIPSALTSIELSSNVDLINKFEFDPPVYEDGKSAEDYLRRKVDIVARRIDDKPTSSDSEGDSASDLDGLFPAGGPTARRSSASPAREKPRRRRLRHKHDELLDTKGLEERQEAKRKAELERQRKIKSDLMVHASDDESDEERDQLFFAEEEKRRKKTARGLIAVVREGQARDGKRVNGGGKRKAGGQSEGKGRKRTVDDDEDEEDVQEEDSDVSEQPAKRRRSGLEALLATSDDDDNDSDSPSSSSTSQRPTSTRRKSHRPRSLAISSSPSHNSSRTTPSSSAPDDIATRIKNVRNAVLAPRFDDAEDVEMAGYHEIDESNKENMDGVSAKAAEVPPVGRRRRVMAGFVLDSDSE